MKAIVENVSIARNGQVVLRMNSLDYWTNEAYLHALLSSKGLPADIFLLQGCEIEFNKLSHKAGDKVIDGNGKETGQVYKKDGQRMTVPQLLALGDDANSYRQTKIKVMAKASLKGSLAGLSFKKSERSAPADNAIVDVQKDGSTTQQTQGEKPSVKEVVDAEDVS